MSLDAVPGGVDPDAVRSLMEQAEGVSGVHHLHIWPISTTETALTAHLVLDPDARPEIVIPAVKQMLCDAGIGHAILEPETAGDPCGEKSYGYL